MPERLTASPMQKLMQEPMQKLVHELCSPACAGRAPGTPGGIRARQHIVSALQTYGLDPAEQRIGSTAAATYSFLLVARAVAMAVATAVSVEIPDVQSFVMGPSHGASGSPCDRMYHRTFEGRLRRGPQFACSI